MLSAPALVIPIDTVGTEPIVGDDGLDDDTLDVDVAVVSDLMTGGGFLFMTLLFLFSVGSEMLKVLSPLAIVLEFLLALESTLWGGLTKEPMFMSRVRGRSKLPPRPSLYVGLLSNLVLCV